jgi:hypothetical protein
LSAPRPRAEGRLKMAEVIVSYLSGEALAPPSPPYDPLRCGLLGDPTSHTRKSLDPPIR